MRRFLKPIVAFVIICGSTGFVHGVRTDRWANSNELIRSISLLENIPKDFGDWRSEELPIESEDVSRAGIKGSFFRKYVNLKSGSSMSIMIVCGRSGPICVHTPDICYVGSGYREISQPHKLKLENGFDEFNYKSFAMPNTIVPKKINIGWSWSTDLKSWSVPDSPRYFFARSLSLFKIYLVSESHIATFDDGSAYAEFLSSFIPELRSAAN